MKDLIQLSVDQSELKALIKYHFNESTSYLKTMRGLNPDNPNKTDIKTDMFNTFKNARKQHLNRARELHKMNPESPLVHEGTTAISLLLEERE